MGAPKGGGYIKQSTLTPTGESTLEQILKFAQQQLGSAGNVSENPLYQQAVEATRQFLPGGQGFAPIQQQAQQQFQRQTIPSILNAFGSGAKSSSALNQALSSAGQDLNSNLAAQLAQMQLGAAQQGAGLAALPSQQSFQQGLGTAQLGLNTTPFAYQQKQTPFWQDALLASINAGGKVVSSAVGAAK